MAVSGTPTALTADQARLVAYEKAALKPGPYFIDIEQKLKAGGSEAEPWKTTKNFRVQATPAHILPSKLLHSFYPPQLQRVPAETLPHVIVNGVVSWERDVSQDPAGVSDAPLPWLALLLFTKEELALPTVFANFKHGSTASLRLSMDSVAKEFQGHHSLLQDSSQDQAEFIFLKASVFKSCFATQEKSPDPQALPPQEKPDLTRYKYLVHSREVLSDAAGSLLPKVSVIMAHRIRTPTAGPPQTVLAHLVSLERVMQIDFGNCSKEDALFPLISLFSWTFEWDSVHVGPVIPRKDLFHNLQPNVRPLVLEVMDEPAVAPAGDLTEQTDEGDKEKQIAATRKAASDWMRMHIENGYTIVRHRAITGEKSTAIYRGPLLPELRTRIQIAPSLYGTDLQILDAETQMLDVSYSMAWELGRSQAARTPHFSIPMAALRRNLVLRATKKAKNAPNVVLDDEVLTTSVLSRLNSLFKDGLTPEKLAMTPADGSVRWCMSPANASSQIAQSGTMTIAKLKRNLNNVGTDWLQPAAKALASQTTPAPPEVDGLQDVITWIESNILSMRLIPALYLFPDPAVLKMEYISTFYIDDSWIDAVIDGALSVGNAVGGTEDLVRVEVRLAINAYLSSKPEASLRMARQGFILRSVFVEAFPDLRITTSNGAVIHQTRNDDMLLCFFDPGPDRPPPEEFKIEISQPPHQQRFGVGGLTTGQLTLSFDVNSFCQPKPEKPFDLITKVWEEGKASPVASVTQPVVDWKTGILVPSALAKASVEVAKEAVSAPNFKALSSNSESLYLAVHLQDLPSSLIIPFIIPAGRSSSRRQLFPDLGDPNFKPAAPKGDAKIHIAPEDHSYLSKMVYALDYPGKSIPLRTDPAVDLVFSVKGTTAATDNIKFQSLTFSIPIGDTARDLLSPEAPAPSARMVGQGRFWICACYKESATKLVVRLNPRGIEVSGNGVDASFQLVGCKINGVLGKNVGISCVETFTVDGSERSVTDAWTVAKE